MTISPFNVIEKTFLITGASSGIGRAAAVSLSRQGARLILTGRDESRLQQTYKLLDGSGHKVRPCDLSHTDRIPELLKAWAKEIGPLQGLVHSAGIHVTAPLRFQREEQLRQLMDVNFIAGVQLAKAIRQRGVYDGPCSVVLISSVMGLVGQSGVSAYAASKGALIAFCRAAALELAAEGIRVNCIAPGQVKTEMVERQLASLTEEQVAGIERMHPLGIGSPEDVANAVTFLLSDAARWITGSTLVVDGGYTAH